MPVTHILGVSCFYHDSAAALVRDGKLIAACAEDRFTRVKHDSSLPVHAARYCLQEAGIAGSDINSVVFYERLNFRFIRVLRTLLSRYPLGAGKFAKVMASWISEKLWIRSRLSEALDLDPARIRFIEHHESHAAYAFYSSPFAQAAVLTLDGVGEEACGCIAGASRNKGISTLETTAYPHSLGLVYGAITGFLGFRPNDAECSTMALAAFGEPAYCELFERIIGIDAAGRLRIDTAFFDFTADHIHAYLPRLTEAIEAPSKDATHVFSAHHNAPGVVPDDARHAANIAASLQRRTEDAILAQVRRSHEVTGESRLCVAGGVFYNAAAVRRVLREGGFDEVYIPPDPGDAGGAAGAALRGSALLGVVPQPGDAGGIYLGPSATLDGVRAMLPHLNPERWVEHAIDGVRRIVPGGLRVRDLDDPETLVAIVAAYLAAGRIVGWVRGRAEFGPRALGARSILCDPSNQETARRLSHFVKRRAAFRPYALSVADVDAVRIFDGDWRQAPWRWMQTTASVRAEVRTALRAALHVDGTTRPQIVAADDHPDFHSLLLAFGARRGLAALLNTSFNDAGEPLVANAEEAMLMFAHTDMEVLVIEDLILEKTWETNDASLPDP